MNWLFDTSQFLSRGCCGPGWTGALRWTYIAANVLIAIAYFAIPALLGILYRSKRQDLPASWMLILFATFTGLCGFTHLSDVLVFWWAPYRLFTGLFVLTALASVATACTLPRVIRVLVKLPSREYAHKLADRLQIEVLKRHVIEQDLRATTHSLEVQLSDALSKLTRLEHERATARWWLDKRATLSEVNAQFDKITSGVPPNPKPNPNPSSGNP